MERTLLNEQVLLAVQSCLDPGQTLDVLEMALSTREPAETPVSHAFTPGLYSRQFEAPAGALVISETHLTEHQFVVSKGKCIVYDVLDKSIETITAPYHGRTLPGTRRLIIFEEDTIWTTFHPTTETDPEVIKSQITKQRVIAP